MNISKYNFKSMLEYFILILNIAIKIAYRISQILPIKLEGYEMKFNKYLCLFLSILSIAIIPLETQAKVNTKAKAKASVKAGWRPPSDYKYLRTNGGIGFGYKWLSSDDYDCKFGDNCWGVEIIMSKSCPTSLYVSVKFLDENDKNIGWTNDTAMGVEKNEPVVLVFDDIEGDASDISLTQLSCY
jgi:hypothetical protein